MPLDTPAVPRGAGEKGDAPRSAGDEGQAHAVEEDTIEANAGGGSRDDMPAKT